MESMVYLQEAAPISEFDFQRKHPHPHILMIFPISMAIKSTKDDFHSLFWMLFPYFPCWNGQDRRGLLLLIPHFQTATWYFCHTVDVRNPAPGRGTIRHLWNTVNHGWLVVWNMNFIFPNSWDDDPIWRTPSFFRGVGQPPTRWDWNGRNHLSTGAGFRNHPPYFKARWPTVRSSL